MCNNLIFIVNNILYLTWLFNFLAWLSSCICGNSWCWREQSRSWELWNRRRQQGWRIDTATLRLFVALLHPANLPVLIKLCYRWDAMTRMYVNFSWQGHRKKKFPAYLFEAFSNSVRNSYELVSRVYFLNTCLKSLAKSVRTTWKAHSNNKSVTLDKKRLE